MEINIRRITADDVTLLSIMAKQTFYDTFTGTCTEEDMQSFLEEYFNKKRLGTEVSNADNFYFFAEAEGAPVAYLQFMEDYNNFPLMKKWRALELKRIYVLTAYHGKGLLNKIVRWETFHTALQYFSYALAGKTYMGVGRNLSYKKAIFFRHKGFTAHNNLPSGDRSEEHTSELQSPC